MAGPLAGISAAQIAQQKVQDQGANQAAKQGPSKFDQHAMKSQGVDPTQKAQGVNHPQAAQKVDVARQVEQVNKTEQAKMNKVGSTTTDNKATAKGSDPVAQKAEVGKSSNALMGMMGNMEKGQASLDKLINGAASGKTFSNAELLSLQAGMYKYSQELDLTSKIVEKATSGLKDTLKTQV
jgi:hypothetical protein